MTITMYPQVAELQSLLSRKWNQSGPDTISGQRSAREDTAKTLHCIMEAVDIHLRAFPSLSTVQGPQVLKTATSPPNSSDAQQG